MLISNEENEEPVSPIRDMLVALLIAGVMIFVVPALLLFGFVLVQDFNGPDDWAGNKTGRYASDREIRQFVELCGAKVIDVPARGVFFQRGWSWCYDTAEPNLREKLQCFDAKLKNISARAGVTNG